MKLARRNFTKTEKLRPAAKSFEENGYYTDAIKKTQPWYDYWEEQERRCKEGYTAGGISITGYHYFYLNFTRIKKLDKEKGEKVEGFPDFWDGDFTYFWAVHIARHGISEEKYNQLKLGVDIEYLDGGRHLVILKGRRSGFTYKGGSMLARNYCMGRRSKNYAMASLGDYLTDDGLLDKGCWPTVDFVETHTPFNQGRLTDKKSKKVSGFKEKTSSGYVEKGRKNQVIGISLKDNPEKARGKGGELGFFEEAGKFPGLVKAWQVCKPSYQQGRYTTGLMAAYGTGGTEGGDYEGLEELFYNPGTYDVLPIKNIWDEGSSTNTCSFFFPSYVNYEGFMDENGNSNMEGARKYIQEKRSKMKQSDTGKSVDQFIAEFPFKPREATLRVDNNIFPTESLQRQRNSVVSENRFNAMSAGILYRQPNGNIKFKPDADRQPIWKFPTPKGIDRRGAVTIKESPRKNKEGEVPNNLYIICHDPYAHDGSPEGSSLGAAYVIKRVNNFSTKYMDCIVASYVGRPDRQDQYNRMLFNLAEYYNAKIAFENNRGNVVQYAKNKRKLEYLAKKPDIIDNKNRRASRRNTSRPYGIPMTKSMKNQGEVYIRDWLTQPVPTPEGESQKTILNTILDPALLSELTNYNQDGNFDRVMSLMVGMYFLEELEQKRIAPKKQKKRDDFFQREDQFFPRH